MGKLTRFVTPDTATVSLKVGCAVHILPLEETAETVNLAQNKVHIDVIGEGVVVRRSGSDISVEQTGLSSRAGVTIIGDVCGNSIITGNYNTVIRSGRDTVVSYDGSRVTVNGKVIQGDDTPPPSVTIFTNHPINLKLDLRNEASLVSSGLVTLLDVAGSAVSSELSIHSMNGSFDMSLSNNARGFAQMNGSVEVSISNSGYFAFYGEFVSVHASASNGARVSTHGMCFGDYKASATNASTISHYGEVQGRVRKSSSNESIVEV